MHNEYIITQSLNLNGAVLLDGAKNAVLPAMAALILTSGRSTLKNVPASSDVSAMIELLKNLGAQVFFDEENSELTVDTSNLSSWSVSPEIMKQMRASILVMGPLLARFKKAEIALPGGCLIGARPIDFHLKAFARMGVSITFSESALSATASVLKAQTFVLDYPSVGATENIVMAATLTEGTTTIINAALEPEVLDLIALLRCMGAQIRCDVPATIVVEGVSELHPVEYASMPDRLEAGTLLSAVALVGGSITLPNAPVDAMAVFLKKLDDMGHTLSLHGGSRGLSFTATANPRAVSFKTSPYPGFPTDLQAPLMAALCCAQGTSTITETVFENRMLHVRELQKMGAQIEFSGNTARVTGVEQLYGAAVIATDIRAGAALMIAGLAAQGITSLTGIHHLERGYSDLKGTLNSLGGQVMYAADFEHCCDECQAC